jgi:hypothetical protein
MVYTIKQQAAEPLQEFVQSTEVLLVNVTSLDNKDVMMQDLFCPVSRSRMPSANFAPYRYSIICLSLIYLYKQIFWQWI